MRIWDGVAMENSLLLQIMKCWCVHNFCIVLFLLFTGIWWLLLVPSHLASSGYGWECCSLEMLHISSAFVVLMLGTYSGIWVRTCNFVLMLFLCLTWLKWPLLFTLSFSKKEGSEGFSILLWLNMQSYHSLRAPSSQAVLRQAMVGLSSGHSLFFSASASIDLYLIHCDFAFSVTSHWFKIKSY